MTGGELQGIGALLAGAMAACAIMALVVLLGGAVRAWWRRRRG